ncbi:MAG: copper transporter [Armatimonadetes bacterium]|nr:copper transporter [Armatimonadota bacterium]MDW8154079.1 copper transporter [Armatimonadota bacterium]
MFLHVLAAATWVGGNVLLFLAAPRLRREDPGAFRALGRVFRTVSWAAVVVLVLTGLWFLATGWDPRGGILAVKLPLVATAIALKAVHDLWIAPRVAHRRGRFVPLATWIGRANLALQISILYLSTRLVR